MHKSIDVVLVALSSPIQIGIYENKKLIDTIVSEKKSSDILPTLYQDIFEKYDVNKLFFANGPGSFMAIKIAYIFLKSISIMKNIELYATDAFKFNENNPIKAIGKLYFVKVSQEIKTQKLELVPSVNFMLPNLLNYDEFTKDTVPIYNIGAVS
ncbi:MAG: hypothetical protein U9N02_00310 [Campylobacterota bacterium]|nr:hypothetical protein [Campylobacterota bacterium]